MDRNLATVYLSIGSNIERRKNLQLAIRELTRAFGELQLSPIYRSEAIGFSGDDFYNLVVGFDTQLSPEDILVELKLIEKRAGRSTNAPKFSSRTLDIDLLNYHDQVLKQPVALPREEILFNAFVLKPLQDIASHWKHPVAHQTIGELWDAFDQKSQRIEVVDTYSVLQELGVSQECGVSHDAALGDSE